jgi:hypothetical protein
MRLIPRNTKVKTSFYKGIGVADIILGLVALALVALAVSSNLNYKYLIALGIASVFIPLFVPVGEDRIYKCAFNMCKHLFSRKRYSENGKDAANFQSITPYEKIDGGVIVNKDGSYTGVLEVKPIEFRLLGGNKQNYIIDGVLTNALTCVGVGQQAAIVKLEKPLNLTKHLQSDLQRIVALADAQENGSLTNEEYVARVDVIEDRMSLVDTLNSEKEINYSTYYIAVTDKSKASLTSTLSVMKRTLISGSIEANILEESELTEFLTAGKRCGTVAESEGKFGIPHEVAFRLTNTVQDEFALSHFVVSGYPLKVPNAWGEELFDLPNTKVVMKLKPVEKSKALKRIDNAIMELSTQAKGKASKIIDKTTHVETLSSLLVRLQNDNEVLFDTTFIITAYDKKGKTETRKAVKRKIRELGFTATDMFGRQQDAYLTSELSFYDSVKISRGIQASSIAACFPFVSNAIEDDDGILLGENKLPAFVNFFKRNSEFVNSNMVVIGKSGSGKSYAAKTVLTHLASCNAKIFVLDPEGEYLNLAKNLHGKVLDVASSKHGKLNPFQIISALDDENDDGTRNSFFTHLQFLEEFYRLILAGINADSLELLNKLTVEAYERKGITPTTDLNKLKPKDYPTFDDLYALISEKLGGVKDDYDKDCLKVVENYIAKFKKGGRNSNLWNGKSDFRTDENFVCFDFQKLLANKNGSIANAQMLLVLKYLENEVIKNRDYNLKNGADRKIVVVVDEAHLFIDEKYPVALDFMYQLAKRIRKYNGMEIVITQSIKDFAGTPETARKSMAIINVSQYSLIFPLSPNDMSDLCALYEKAGQINDVEADNIVHNERGCAFLISSPESRTNIRIVATPYFEKLFN